MLSSGNRSLRADANQVRAASLRRPGNSDDGVDGIPESFDGQHFTLYEFQICRDGET